MSPLNIFDRLPIALNNCTGDPICYLDDTISKLNQLKGHQGPICIMTKNIITKNICEKIIKSIDKHNKLVIFYSFTGLDEGGISFIERQKSLSILCDYFNNISLFLRPIIKSRNDSPQLLSKIITLASEKDIPLTYGGFKPTGVYKQQLEDKTEKNILSICDDLGVKVFRKTSCCTSYMLQNGYCSTHIKDGTDSSSFKSKNLEIVKKFGYSFDLIGDKIHLQSGTKGDLSFLRMITQSQPIINNVDITSGTVKFSKKDNPIDVTSSWFIWANNWPQCNINCDYCIIRNTKLKNTPMQVGCHPRELLKFIN